MLDKVITEASHSRVIISIGINVTRMYNRHHFHLNLISCKLSLQERDTTRTLQEKLKGLVAVMIH